MDSSVYYAPISALALYLYFLTCFYQESALKPGLKGCELQFLVAKMSCQLLSNVVIPFNLGFGLKSKYICLNVIEPIWNLDINRTQVYV